MIEREDLLIGTFPSVPKQERAQQKRNALMESARILFITNGYGQTTAKDIAAHAGVAVGTFYRYFSDKRQLLMALLEDKLEKLLPPEPNWTASDPETLIAALLENHVKHLNALGLQRVLPELLPKDEELAEVIGSARRKLHARIISGLEQAREKNLTWTDLDLDTVAWSMMVLAENMKEKEQHSGKPIDFYQLAKVICRLVFPPNVLVKIQTNEAKD